MTDKIQNLQNPLTAQGMQDIQTEGRLSQVGKTTEEMLPFLTSGESDDLNFDQIKK